MIGTDDPRLTAYAVDEVDAETAAAVERALRDHVSVAAAVEETRDAARLVQAVFAAEATPALRDEQRRAIAEAAARADRPSRRGFAIGGGLAAAATVVLAVLLLRGRSSSRIDPPCAAPRPKLVLAMAGHGQGYQPWGRLRPRWLDRKPAGQVGAPSEGRRYRRLVDFGSFAAESSGPTEWQAVSC